MIARQRRKFVRRVASPLNAKSARDFRLPTDGPDDNAGKLVRGDKIPRCESDDDRLNSFRRAPLNAASRGRAHTRETTVGRRADRAADESESRDLLPEWIRR